MKVSLDELALKFGTDKSSKGHNYCPLYEKHLPEEVNNFLEVGVFKGHGIQMFREWYNEEGKFYGMDRFIEGYGLITIAELQALGINAYHGSQADLWFLETIKEQFTIISDDASHHWLDQIITFKRMFIHNIEPGGWYVCEDVFYESYWGQGIIQNPNDNLKGALLKYQQHGTMVSQCINQQESDSICAQIEEVHIYENIVFVKKKL